MKPAKFDYFAPTTLDEALELRVTGPVARSYERLRLLFVVSIRSLDAVRVGAGLFLGLVALVGQAAKAAGSTFDSRLRN